MLIDLEKHEVQFIRNLLIHEEHGSGSVDWFEKLAAKFPSQLEIEKKS